MSKLTIKDVQGVIPVDVVDVVDEIVTEVISPEDYSELFIQPKEDEPILYGEYTEDTFPDFLDELEMKFESIPREDKTWAGTISIQVTYHPKP